MIKCFLVDRQNNTSAQQEYTMNATVVFGDTIDVSGSVNIQFQLSVHDWSLLTDSILGLFTIGEGDDRISMAITDSGSYFYLQVGAQNGVYSPIYSHKKQAVNTITFSIVDSGINKSYGWITFNGSAYPNQSRAPYWTTKNNGYGLLGDFADEFDNALVKTIHDYAIEDFDIIDGSTLVIRHQWLGAGDWTDQAGSADGTYSGTYEGLDTFTFARNYEYEFVLEWFGRGGEYYQYLFTDFERSIGSRATLINEKNSNIRNIDIDETNTFKLYVEDISLNDIDYISSIMVASKVRRVNESGVDYFAVVPGSFRYKQSGLRFDLEFMVVKQKVNYV